MDNIWITVVQIFILTVEVGVGYVFAQKRLISSKSLNVLTVLCTKIALPCSVVLSVSGLDHSFAFWRGISINLGVMMIVMIIQILVSSMMFQTKGDKERAVYRMACIYGNSAFMGIPLVTAVLGPDAVIYAVLMVIFDTIFLFAHAALSVDGSKITVRFLCSKLFNTVTVSLLIGIALCLSGIRVPVQVSTCLSDFSGMLAPLAMIIIGIQLADQDMKDIFVQKSFYTVSVIKLIVWPVIILSCMLPMRGILAPAGICAMIICKATPQSAVLGVLADSNGLNGKAAAGMIGLTTLLSILTLPIVTATSSILFPV